jgi:hypothetical protein
LQVILPGPAKKGDLYPFRMMARLSLSVSQHHMKFETYKNVLEQSGNQGARQTAVVNCAKWQVDDSAFELISEEAGLFLSPLRPTTTTPVSTAIWYHSNSRKSSQHHDEACRFRHLPNLPNHRHPSLQSRA